MNKNTKNLTIIGVILIIILLLGGYLFMTNNKPVLPITSLSCNETYFNFVLGKPEIIVSARGTDTKATNNITCQYNYTDPNGTPSANMITGQLSDTPGGKSWSCFNTNKVLPKGTSKFTVSVTDDHGGSTSCSSSIYLPK